MCYKGRRPPVKTVHWHFDRLNLSILSTLLGRHFKKEGPERGASTKTFYPSRGKGNFAL